MDALIIDTETTGLTEPELVEYGQRVVGFREGATLHFGTSVSRWCPSKPIEFGAMATHGILDEDVAESPSSSAFQFKTECGYLIGHNIDFDWQVIGKPDIKRICTLALARHLWPDANHRLMALMYMFDRHKAREMHATAHGVATDIEATFILLEKVIKIMAPTGWEHLWTLSEKARVPSVMPFGKHKGQPVKSLPADYKRWMLGQADIDPYLRQALEAA